jgi:hypothetical protein
MNCPGAETGNAFPSSESVRSSVAGLEGRLHPRMTMQASVHTFIKPPVVEQQRASEQAMISIDSPASPMFSDSDSLMMVTGVGSSNTLAEPVLPRIRVVSELDDSYQHQLI